MTIRNSWLAFVLVGVLVAGFLLVSDASASVTGTVLTGSSGTMTFSLNSEVFNNDPAAIGGGNSDVSNGTSVMFVGCASGVLGSPGCLSTQEGVTVNNADLTLTAPSAANANTFLTFAANPNLVYSINWPPGPGSPNTNCATANSNGLSCSIFAGSPLVLTFDNGNTFIGLGVTGKASDLGVAGLASGSNYSGGFSQFFTQRLPNGMAPTPDNIQLFFCPSGICQPADFTSGKSITTSQSGTFTATLASPTPEPSSILLSFLGAILMLGTGLLKSCGIRA